jgi:hypothetical protein
MAGIFISYRREDSRGDAGRLFDRLKAHFRGEHKLFKDVDSLRPGEDFPVWIRETVPSCRVLIVVIGKNWLSAADERGQARLRDKADWVRIEILTALEENLHIIPVLVGDARMPTARELPRPLARLASRTALEISDASFDEGTNRLIECLDELLGSARKMHDRLESLWLSNWTTSQGLSRPEKPAPAAGEKKFGIDDTNGFLPVLSFHSSRLSARDFGSGVI